MLAVADDQAPRRRTLTFADIERRRREANVSANALIAAARIAPATYFNAKRGIGAGHPKRQDTLRRLARALDTLAAEQVKRTPSVIVGLVRSTMFILNERSRDRRALVVALSRPRPKGSPPPRQRPRYVAPARLRHLAIYLVAVELEISNAEIGRALKMTRQAVKQLRDDVEDLREKPIVEAWLDSMADLMRGEV